MTRFVAFIFLGCIACNTGADKAFEGSEDSTSYAGKPAYAIISANAIPAGIRVKGNIEEAWKWTDASGDNVLVLSRVAPYGASGEEGGEEGQTAELYASVFRNVNGNYEQSWVLSDAETNCPLDLTYDFLPVLFQIRDFVSTWWLSSYELMFFIHGNIFKRPADPFLKFMLSYIAILLVAKPALKREATV